MPGLIVLAFVVIAVGLVEAEGLVDRDVLADVRRLFGAGAENFRSMLATIAGSVITVAGVTFSITVLAVTRASSSTSSTTSRARCRRRASSSA